MASNVEEAAICQVVNFDVLDDEQCTSTLTVRVRRKWIHIAINLDGFSMSGSGTKPKTSPLKDTYLQFRDAVIDQQLHEEHEGQEERSRENTDSGYASAQSDSQTSGEPKSYGDAERDIQNWLLAPFGKIFDDLAPPSKDKDHHGTVYDFYSSDLYHFELQADEDKLNPVELNDEDELKTIRRSYCPSMTLPKYLRSLPGVPWYSPKDLEVLAESDEPVPVHPTVVRQCSREQGAEDDLDADNAGTFFFKVHAPNKDSSTKREIRYLQDIKKKALHEQGVRTPQLLGLVASIDSPSSKAQVLGFLLTSIPNPTPLNSKLESSIPQPQREKWAKESEDMVNTLHEAGLVWGDVKADNFVVDEDGILWMIDFGGGYTEGWVDSELFETIEGDNQGTEKLVDALKDPDANTSESIQGEDQQDSIPAPQKRKRQADSEDDQESETRANRRKHNKR